MFESQHTGYDRRGFKAVALCAAGLLAGLVAGILTIVLSVLLNAGLAGMLLGCIFGFVLSVYFFIFLPDWSALKALGFVAVSAAAYIVAFYLTFFSSEWIGFDNAAHSNAGMAAAPYGSYFIGGFVGAFLVLCGALSLFFPEMDLLEILAKALIWSFAGGVLGVVGFILGPYLGQIPIDAFSNKNLTGPGNEDNVYQFSLFLIWQAGMGLVFGVLLVQSKSRLASFSDVKRLPSRSIKTFGEILIAISVLVVGCFFIPVVIHSVTYIHK